MRRLLCVAAVSALLSSSCVITRVDPVLYLVPIHAAPELMDALAAYYREKLGLNVQTLAAMQADSLAFDQARQQLVAEELVQMIRDRYRGQVRSGSVIGVTSWDMYIRSRPWQFGFSWREAPYAVVSYARMDPARLGEPESRDRLLRRLRKMISKNVGVLMFRLGPSTDRTSVMYQDIMGVDDLDRIEEDLARAGFPAPQGS